MFGKLAPNGGGPPIPLLKRKVVVGRHQSCDIPLCLPTVSSRHCELELTDGYWLVRDLGSKNGTCVNGKACQSEWLWPNDVLWVAFKRFSVVYEAPPGRPPPQRMGSSAEVKSPAPEATAESPRGMGTVAQPRQVSTMAVPCLGKLVPCGGGPPIPLLKSKVIVGRHESCDAVVRCSSVSGRHCELEWTDGAWLVRDLKSRNGIRVDGVRCEEKRLAPGNILWFAGLRYEIVYTPQGTQSPPAQKGPAFAQTLLEKAGLSRMPSEKSSPPPPHREVEEDPPRQRYSLDNPE